MTSTRSATPARSASPATSTSPHPGGPTTTSDSPWVAGRAMARDEDVQPLPGLRGADEQGVGVGHPEADAAGRRVFRDDERRRAGQHRNDASPRRQPLAYRRRHGLGGRHDEVRIAQRGACPCGGGRRRRGTSGSRGASTGRRRARSRRGVRRVGPGAPAWSARGQYRPRPRREASRAPRAAAARGSAPRGCRPATGRDAASEHPRGAMAYTSRPGPDVEASAVTRSLVYRAVPPGTRAQS